MAKKGKTLHLKRIATKTLLPIRNKKHKVFLVSPSAGPHPKAQSLALVVLIRDELGLAKDYSEARKIIKQGFVYVDGRICKDPKRPIGLLDVIFVKPLNKYWRMEIIKGKLKANPIQQPQAKYCKVVGKHTIKKAKISIGLHDGKNIIADNMVKVGDSVKISLPDYKIIKLIKLENGANCYIFKGKHAGKFGTLQKIIEQRGSMGSIAVLKSKQDNKEILTSLNYIMVIDDEFNG
ncbi:MAG: S4 domain-containing protein [Candidatus Micrarchaeota archaeon]|nr:S4 domain-containing protein [Candidatus Micrarchaeota archaeon]